MKEIKANWTVRSDMRMTEISWKRCAAGFRYVFSCLVVAPISSNMYRHHAVLKRQLAQWVQVKSLIRVLISCKILQDMFVMRVL